MESQTKGSIDPRHAEILKEETRKFLAENQEIIVQRAAKRIKEELQKPIEE